MKANKFFAIALAALALMACNKKEEPQPEKLKVTPEVAEVSVGATVQLTANMEVTWSSSDEAIAGVNDKGLVTGIKEGEVNISAKAVKTNEVAVCKVTVKAGGVIPPVQQGISVTDNSIEDWKALPADKVASCACPADGGYLGLKGVAVYADELYINVLVEYDPEEIPNHESVPFHVYINTDNSDLTGGYGDQWNDANVDIMMEGFFFLGEEGSGTGEPCDYVPVIVPWTGEVGGSGWGWGAELVPAAPCVASQHVTGNYVELQMMRELVPTLVGWNADEFGIGFDIQQSWESVGILPLVSPTDDNPTGHTNKLQVKIYK